MNSRLHDKLSNTISLSQKINKKDVKSGEHNEIKARTKQLTLAAMT